MNVLKKTVFTLIVEGKIEDLQARYPALDVKEIAKNDPSSTKKYLAWMCKQLSLGAPENDLYPTVKSFDKNISRIKNKDVNTYKTAKELEDVIKSLPEKSKSQQREETKGNAPKIYEDDENVIVRPDDKNSCITYGAGTKWCITMKDASYYEQYTEDNVIFYFIISKVLEQRDPWSKIALAMIRDDDNKVTAVDVYDAEDKQLRVLDIELKFLNLCKADAVKQPMKFSAKIKSGKASVKELIEASKSGSEEIRIKVAEAELTPPEVLVFLANDKSTSVLYSLLDNTELPVAALETLSKNRNTQVREYVADHVNVTPEILSSLADDIDVVLKSVAANDKTPSDVLEKLSTADEHSIRAHVARNKNTLPETLAELAKDDEYVVLRNLARNPNTPTEVLRNMFSDQALHSSLASNPSLPVDVLEFFVNSNDDRDRANVAQNPSLTPEFMRELAKDELVAVKQQLAINKNAPSDVLELLSKSTSNEVKKRVATNKNTPIHVLEFLSSGSHDRIVMNLAWDALAMLKQNKNKNESLMRIFISEIKRTR